MKKEFLVILIILCFVAFWRPVYALDVQKIDDTGFYLTEVAPSFSEGLVWCAVRGEADTTGIKYGYLNSKGEVAIPFQFDYASDFQCGLACVIKDNVLCYCDKNGNIVISTGQNIHDLERQCDSYHWQSLFDFHGGLALYCDKQGKWGYIDKTGNIQIPCLYDLAEPFHDGVAIVENDEGITAINSDGKEIFQAGRYSYCVNLGSGIIAVSDNITYSESDFFYLMDISGHIVSQKIMGYPETKLLEDIFIVRKIGEIYDSDEAFEKANKNIAYDQTGKALWSFPAYKTERHSDGTFLPHEYQLQESHEGRIAYCYELDTGYIGEKPYTDSFWGYLDSKTGNVVISAHYQEAAPYSEHVAFVLTSSGAIDILDLNGRSCINNDIVAAEVLDWQHLQFIDGKSVLRQLEINQVCDNNGQSLHEKIKNMDGMLSKDTFRTMEKELLQDAVYKTKFSGNGILSNPMNRHSSERTLRIQAQPSVATVLVDGKTIAFEAYNIAENNYFKLRDLAAAFNGSEKQFSIQWDETQKAISLQSGQPYRGKVEGCATSAKTATVNTAKLYKDGVAVTLTAYNIEGNTYFKLRDIGNLLGFSMTWDAEKNKITI